MTDNEKLARWQEWEEYHSDMNKHVPDYLNDDAAAMSLLDTLVEKGYDITLMTTRLHPTLWMCRVFNSSIMIDRQKPTRRAAICTAVLKLIGKEDV